MLIQSNELKKLISVCFGSNDSYLNKKIIRDVNNKEKYIELLFNKYWFYNNLIF